MSSRAHLRLWELAGMPEVALFRADHFQQRFARHSHEEYAVGAITGGALGFDYLGAGHVAGAGELNVVVPGEVHTEHPALGEEWSYRMFYIQPTLVQEVARDLRRPQSLPFFGAGVIRDAELAATLLTLHGALDRQALLPLEAQCRLIALLATWIHRHAERNRRTISASACAPDVARVREFLETCWQNKPQLRQLADLVHLSPFQLIRAFVRHTDCRRTHT